MSRNVGAATLEGGRVGKCLTIALPQHSEGTWKSGLILCFSLSLQSLAPVFCFDCKTKSLLPLLASPNLYTQRHTLSVFFGGNEIGSHTSMLVALGIATSKQGNVIVLVRLLFFAAYLT